MDIILVKLVDVYKNKIITVNDASFLVVNAMQLAEKYEKKDKKAVVLAVLKEAITHCNCEDKETLLFIIDTIVPGMIDRLIDVNNGGITFGKKSCCW